MKNCKHECPVCKEQWECDFPYNSEYQHLQTTISFGYYCNAWCPTCNSDKRDKQDELFSYTSETGYFKGLNTYSVSEI